MKKADIAPDVALAIFASAPDDSLLTQGIVAHVMGVPTATLEKARSVGDPLFPKFVKVGARVRYRAGSVRRHLAMLAEQAVA